MKERLIINRFWLTKGLETYMLGIYFVFRQDLFEPPYHSILNYLDKLPSIIVLLITGTVAILYALTNSGNQKYRALMSGTNTPGKNVINDFHIFLTPFLDFCFLLAAVSFLQ